MCTLTYAPSPDGFTIISSRDELKTRPTIPPKIYDHHGQVMIYPKDEIGGGSWIAAAKNKRISCLLNGAFAQYYPLKKYPKSRGEIVLKSSSEENWPSIWESMDLYGYESFTLVTIELTGDPKISLWIWDEHQKHRQIRNHNKPFILSSSTLYDEVSKQERQEWFDHWIEKHKHLQDYNLSEFHTYEHCGLMI
jgi:hypothetical protein